MFKFVISFGIRWKLTRQGRIIANRRRTTAPTLFNECAKYIGYWAHSISCKKLTVTPVSTFIANRYTGVSNVYHNPYNLHFINVGRNRRCGLLTNMTWTLFTSRFKYTSRLGGQFTSYIPLGTSNLNRL